jgi:hypothetical protein
MLLMVVGAMGTEFDLHAYMVSKPPDESPQPKAAGFPPRLTPGVLSPISDRHQETFLSLRKAQSLSTRVL